jgi:hypothetical protein
MIQTGQLNIQRARQAQETILKDSVLAGIDMDALMKLAIIQIKIDQGKFDDNIKVPVDLTDSEKTQFSNNWRTFRERNANLIKHRGNFLANPGSMYPADPRQNEAIY